MKDKKFVQHQYPSAKVFPEPGGGYMVYVDELAIAEEYLLPVAKTKSEAWLYARMALKTTQNFNRTHPERLSLIDIEKKLDGIHRRKYNGKKRSNEIIRSYKK